LKGADPAEYCGVCEPLNRPKHYRMPGSFFMAEVAWVVLTAAVMLDRNDVDVLVVVRAPSLQIDVNPINLRFFTHEFSYSYTETTGR